MRNPNTMSGAVPNRVPRVLHPLHAFFLAATTTAFVGALLSDFAYATSFQVQWTNFASWLITAGLVFGGIALIFALAGIARFRSDRPYLVYGSLVAAAWILGFVNALVHARDAWASMPAGIILSTIVAIAATLAAWLGFSTLRSGDHS